MVTPTTDVPTYDATLSDGATTLGFILVNSRGERDITALRRFSLVRTPLKTSSGESKYADLEPPYVSDPQDDWTGGRGQEHFEDDKSRFFDSYRIDTLKQAGVILGGQETYSTGYRDVDQSLPGSVTWQALTGTQQYLSKSFTASASYTTAQVEVWVRRVGTPGNNLSVGIYSDSGGDPNTSLDFDFKNTTHLTDTVSTFYRFSVATALTATTTYHVVVYSDGADTSTDHWEVATSATTNGKKSGDGSAWSTATNSAIYYRVTGSDTAQKFKFFEYKRAIYAVTQLDNNGNSSLYMNGYRGAADSNSGNLDRLIDGTAPFTADELIGGIVLVIAGPGSQESQPWRTITDNTTTDVIVDSNWLITQTTSTEYVIVKTDIWQSLSGVTLGDYVTDIEVADDFVYFALDESATNVLRYQEYNNGGTWTTRTNSEPFKAAFLKAVRHPDGGIIMYGAQNQNDFYNQCVWKARVPKRWEDLYRDLGTALETDTPWDAQAITNVTQGTQYGATKIDIASGFSTGTVAVKNLDTAVDITQGRYLAMLIYSSAATSAGDLQLLYDDVTDLGQNFQPTGFKSVTIASGVPTYVDEDDAIDEMDETYATISITTAGLIVISSERFNSITFDIGGTPNAAAETMAAEYSSGDGFQSLTISDGTETGGDTTLAQDGSITFTIPSDWESATIDGTTGYAVHLVPTGSLTASVTINEVYVSRQNNVTMNVPAIAAGEYIWALMSITPKSYPHPDESAIKSFGLKVATDVGAQTVYILDGIHIIDDSPELIDIPDDGDINGLEVYSGSPEDPRENVWVLTENAVYEVQSQNDDTPVRLPLKELSELRGIDNGVGHTTNDVYLYFNLQNKLERYFNRNLDDIGPDRDAGLPADRQGTPLSLVSYPGRVLVAIDAGSSNYSSVLALSGESIHEVYRGHRTGGRIRNMALQSIPGSSTSWLWINEGADILRVPISLDPYRDSDYTFVHEGTITSSYLHSGLQDVLKLFKSLKIFGENLSANYNITADYRTDGSSSWTPITGTFDTVPTEEINFSASTPPNVSARRIQYRLHFYTNDNSQTPRLKAAVIESAAFIADKGGWNLQFLLGAKELAMIDREGNVETNDVSTIFNQLATWRQAQALTLRTISTPSDNLTVFISDGPGLIMMGKELDTENSVSQEEHIGQITIQQL